MRSRSWSTSGGAHALALALLLLAACRSPTPSSLEPGAPSAPRRDLLLPPGNLTTNPSFETDTTGWTVSSADAALTRVTVADAPDGSAVARVSKPTAGKADFGIFQRPVVTSITAGTVYVAAAQVKATAAASLGKTVSVTIQERDSGLQEVGRSSAPVTLTNAFQSVAVSRTAISSGNDLSVTVTQAAGSKGDAFDVDAITLVVATASHLSFTTPSRSFLAGQCSGAGAPITVRLQTSDGVPVNAGGGGQSFTAVTSASGSGTWYTDTACNTAATANVFTIPAGSSSVNLYYRDTAVGTPTVSLTNGSGLTNPQPQQHQVTAGGGGFADDFESGTYLVSQSPPGKWDGLINNAGTVNTLEISAQAARRGTYGMRVVDGRTSTGSGAEVSVFKDHVAATDAYQRYWVRMVATSPGASAGLDSFMTSQIRCSGGVQPTVLDVRHELAAGNTRLAGFDMAGTYSRDTPVPMLTVNQWHLVEVALTGVGTTNGLRRLWLNGNLISTSAPIDYSSMVLDRHLIGIPYTDTFTATATIDFDDYRFGATPMASRITLTAPASATSGSCSPVELSLHDSVSGASAPAPYEVIANLGVAGVTGSFFSDAACTASVTTATIPLNSNTATTYFKATTGGTASLSATHLDFLSVPTNVTITATTTTPQLVFTTPPQTPGVAVPGEAITLQRQDSTGAPLTSGTLTVSVTTTSASGRFMPAPTAPVSTWTTTYSLTIADGASSASFHYADGMTGSVTLSAQATGFSNVTQAMTVTPDSFQDDFETGTLLRSQAPAGRWLASQASASVTIATQGPAAHRGTWGMRVGDGNSVSGSGTEARTLLRTAPVVGEYRFRFWYRIAAATNTTAGFQFLLSRAYETSDPHHFRLNQVLPSGELTLAGVDDSGTDQVVPTGQTLSVGTWYLIEGSMQGLGTANGVRRVLVDGVLRAERTGLDWRNARLRGFDVGEPWAVNRLFAGDIDIDDFRASTVPLASTLRLSAPGPVAFGACVPVTVSLADSETGANAPAPYPLTATVAADAAGGTFYSDPNCLSGGGSVSFPYWSTSSQVAYFRPATAGAVRLRATHGDFLSTPLDLVVNAPLAQGAACTANESCFSGECVDGVCCDSPCGEACMACNVAGAEGICSAEPNGTSCADATYCNGAEACSAGICQAGTPVQCVDGNKQDALACSEATQSCEVVPNSPPQILEDALLTTGIGLAYPYNGAGAVSAVGDRPMTFSSCGVLPGFSVDAQTGAVQWTPTALGTFTICVAAQNAYGADTYTFTVTVLAPQGEGPTARMTLTPSEGNAPLIVTVDGSGSSSDPSTSIVSYEWRFGEGGLPTTGATAGYVYRVPGVWTATLTVIDGYGRPASTSQPVSVRSASGQRGPSAGIAASVTQGSGPLEVGFTCDCQPGDAPLKAQVWDFGDGSVRALGDTARHTFEPGRYTVAVTVVDAAGLTATAEQTIIVLDGDRLPPSCEAFASPASGLAPLDVLFASTSGSGATAGTGAGTALTVEWTLWDGSTATSPQVAGRFEAPGRYAARLRVTDEAGLSCTDRVEAVVTDADGRVPPQILFVSSAAAACGMDAQYLVTPHVVVAGEGPYTFSAETAPAPADGMPTGLSVDPGTATLLWSPDSSDVGQRAFALRVQTPTGTDAERVDIDVSCGAEAQYAVGCGCASGGGGSLPLLSFVLALSVRAWARRRRSSSAGGE